MEHPHSQSQTPAGHLFHCFVGEMVRGRRYTETWGPEQQVVEEDTVHVQDDTQVTTRSYLRILRQSLDTVLPFLGVVVILSAVLFLPECRGQVAIVVLGMLLLEAGVWQLAHHVLPSERQYLALRYETDRFITLVRQLNAAALMVKAHDSPTHRHAFEDVRYAMQQTVARLCEVAGRTEAELAAERGVLVSQGGIPHQKERALDTASPE